MPLGAFLTFLAFLTRKLRREALGRRLAAKQTRSLLDGLVRAVWLRLVTTKTGSRAIHRWQVNSLLFLGGTGARKVRKARKGVRVMTRSTFPTFLTFLTRRLCFSGSCRRPSAREFGRAARICVRYTMSPRRRLQHRRSHASR